MTNVTVHRHRTAMVRHTLSQPMSLAVRHGMVRPGVTVFDYGCGQGDDLRALAAAGVEAVGWDPHFAPEAPRHEGEIVNLGFVLNVIEDPVERADALKGAWALATRVLIVSVMIVGAVPVDGLRQFGDGYVTARGTFQKYFQQAELKAMLTLTSGIEPVALAPGIFALFRSPEDEQDFLLDRRRGCRASTSAYRANRPARAAVARPQLADRIASAVDAIANFALERGRLPHPDEMEPGLHDLLAAERVSFARAIEASRDDGIDAGLFAQAATERREDLLVHQALNILNRSRTAARPSPAIVRDIRHHFGSQQQFGEQALEYLHALADPQRTVIAMRRAAASGLGALDEDERLVIDSKRVSELEGVLRCYVGCALYLSGDIEQEHLVRLDPLRRRTTLFPLAGRRQPFPETNISITIDLKRQDFVVRTDSRVLVRKADVFGMARRSRQRSLEEQHRITNGNGEVKVLVRT
ncbi:DNA phosphorothioation-associated putative methyltransferase [Sphingomonas sp. UYEF23]|uniref:DNA phosphorothioation-associated putative methyltransferase n=1 Tax=Sphingomonas sp. UYEF23 TaxID=1756408 RepID=UPI003397E4D2